MLYVFHGSDTDTARTKGRDLAEALKKKKPDASFFEITPETWNPQLFQEYTSGQGLFERKYIILARGLLGDTTFSTEVIELLPETHTSESVFIFVEGELTAPIRKKIEVHADKTQEFEKKKAVKKEAFNVFSLTDALAHRNAAQLWTLYQQALEEGIEPEHIHGVLWWQIKSMLVAAQSRDAKESGLSPFVYSKAKKGSELFAENELREKAEKLVELYHEARRGNADFTIGLEKFILGIGR